MMAALEAKIPYVKASLILRISFPVDLAAKHNPQGGKGVGLSLTMGKAAKVSPRPVRLNSHDIPCVHG